ncbi:YhgE/Pip domain-containing protein [Cohnella zeiphila]|uniref:YhgE/Pip domain-containing protein n=1 Tax=Cohnella zeiphila TaxID=2761120 RepID=A0A7X0VWL7_9BACL|nr:YhgE/Pip domain-containing protein [Cohnella zeiphila]MBB6733101.1 YhgE/Pip domain-containing protein [Cohnella zeiphila]
MKAIARIYAGDLRRIVTNPAAAVIIAGLAALPSLYAWFNIEASWDPYGQTGRLPVAVVNRDAGTTVRGTPVNVGKEVVAALRQNPKIGWEFKDEAEAMRGVKYGDDYAAIVIPPEFSARLATVLEETPQAAEIDYYVNEKINAIAPKITSSGATGIVEEVSSRFVETANGIIFNIFNQVGSELEANLPEIEKLESLIFELEDKFPEIRAAADTAQLDLEKLNGIVGTARRRLPEAAKLVTDGQALAGKAQTALQQVGAALSGLAPGIKQDLVLLRGLAGAAADASHLLANASADPQAARAALAGAADRAGAAADAIGRIADLLGQVDALASAHPLAGPIAKLKEAGDSFRNEATALKALETAVSQGQTPAKELADRASNAAEQARSRLDDWIGSYDTVVVPRVNQAVQQAGTVAGNAQKALAEAVQALPEVQDILNRASQGLAVGTKGLAAIRAELPAAEQKVRELADKIRAFRQEGNLRELIALLRHNAQRQSEFFAKPVVLKENQMFPVGGYGSAMSPFFSTLSLWVGALLLVSLLSVDVHEPGAAYRTHDVYFGRYLTFATLAAVQSLIVTLGDIWLLGTHVAAKGWFILFGVGLSLLFMLMVYTLVSVFGNVGKAMAIVLLVLQLGGAGGTFPIQLAPAFFRAIHPFLPFTYGIGLMREAVGGILWDAAFEDIVRLCAFAAGALVLGLALKRPMERLTAGMVAKARESRLIH